MEIERKFKVKLLYCLNKLKQGNIPNCKLGICQNVTAIANVRIGHFVTQLSLDWDKYSGNQEYPVPCTEGTEYDNPEDQYLLSDAFKMWSPDHPYGKMRWELVDHLITKLNNDLYGETQCP